MMRSGLLFVFIALAGCAHDDGCNYLPPSGKGGGFSHLTPQKYPLVLTGYKPGQEIKDPYTGKIYVASPEGTVTIQKPQ